MTHGQDLVIGYGKGEIEPQIVPLVRAIRAAGFNTFSSCEGHITHDGESIRLPSVSFYAHEEEARRVHEAFLPLRPCLLCSWILRAGFKLHRETKEWMLGWTLENCGIVNPGPGDDWIQQTLDASRQKDMPALAKMFGRLHAASRTDS